MSSTAEFLFELRVEEIPAGFLADATAELRSRVEKILAEAGLAEGTTVSVFDTPRRLVVRIENLATEIPEREVEVTGPPKKAAFKEDGTPTPAALGFARTHGVEASALRIVSTAKGEYAGLTKTVPAVPSRDVLAKALPPAVSSLPWPKTMRWGDGRELFVRPVHGVVAMLGGEVVPMSLFGIASGRTTIGHRVTGEARIELDGSFEGYRSQLEAAGVIVSAARRREILVARCLELTAEASAELGGTPLRVHEDERLLDLLTHLTEHPGLLLGRIREEFLALPAEILVTSIREHQKSFVVETVDAAGNVTGIAPFFLAPMDQVADPVGAIRRGNEWVVAARLSDAKFFLAEDRRTPFEEKAPRLAKLAFHEKLGSYADKARRMETLASWLATETGQAGEREAAPVAARLAKVDLVTEMVKEFTDLQGVVGGLYAKAEGLPEPVWQAVYDHYRPKSESDPIPRGAAGGIVALADKLDSLAGFFGLGLVPTGSKDPYALRRAAQGAVRILLENGWPLDLERASMEAAGLYGDRLPVPAAEVAARLAPFWQERIRWQLERRGFRYDEIAAVLATGSAPLPDILGRVEALAAYRESTQFRSLVLAFKRIVNIVSDQPDGPAPDAAIFVEKAERLLFEAFTEARGRVDAALEGRNHVAALEAIATLAEPLDRFFVDVMVLCEDPRVRTNRVALLRVISKGFSRFAVFSEVVAERK